MLKPSAVAVALTLLFSALCGVSAALQYNDPDPLRWIAIYLAAGASAAFLLLDPRPWAVTALVAAIALVWAIALWVGVAGHVGAGDFVNKMSEKGGKVEEMREAGGLTIAAIGCAIAAYFGRQRVGKPTY